MFKSCNEVVSQKRTDFSRTRETMLGAGLECLYLKINDGLRLITFFDNVSLVEIVSNGFCLTPS